MNRLQDELKRTWPVANALYKQALGNVYFSEQHLRFGKAKYMLIGQEQFTKLVDAIARDTLQPSIDVARGLRSVNVNICGCQVVPCDLPNFCGILYE